ncbi:MAG: hypothetical protein ACKO3T_24725, partial [Planctomycetaceae bacterium]
MAELSNNSTTVSRGNSITMLTEYFTMNSRDRFTGSVHRSHDLLEFRGHPAIVEFDARDGDGQLFVT